MKEISKYATFLSGILAFVLSSTAILFLVLALFIPSYEENEVSVYFLIAGIVLTGIAVLFIVGLNVLKKNRRRGADYLLGASALFILACIAPIIQLIVSFPILSIKVLIIVAALILCFPFTWLIVYLWRLKKTKL